MGINFRERRRRLGSTSIDCVSVSLPLFVCLCVCPCVSVSQSPVCLLLFSSSSYSTHVLSESRLHAASSSSPLPLILCKGKWLLYSIAAIPRARFACFTAGKDVCTARRQAIEFENLVDYALRIVLTHYLHPCTLHPEKSLWDHREESPLHAESLIDCGPAVVGPQR